MGVGGGLNRTSVGLKRKYTLLYRSVYSCLNRTSVGLKLVKARRNCASSCGPQSNQRGIETFSEVDDSCLANLRLNRTSVGLKHLIARRLMPPLPCLNRTSVGLKLTCPNPSPPRALPPQSNQRGIETVRYCTGGMSLQGPQSNQRGIETGLSPEHHGAGSAASIEPAWD